MVYEASAGGGAGPKSSSLLSESDSSVGGFGGLSERGAGGAEGPRTRAGFAGAVVVGPGGAGPISFSGLLERDLEVGGNDGPRTLRRFSLDSGLVDRSSSSSLLRFARCGGSEGPTEGMSATSEGVVVGNIGFKSFRCVEVRLLELGRGDAPRTALSASPVPEPTITRSLIAPHSTAPEFYVSVEPDSKSVIGL
jgi:hypothetical protein